MHTIDSLIEALEQQKAAGMAGTTAVVVQGQDNNGKGGFAHRVTFVTQASLAKNDFEKGWEVCKIVSNRGVKALLIA